ncbi:MAG: hypothetical protein H6729_15745 [Deltaproteobacteria bacterium]|nr:hypothetical protein [Deltaproteobacteria bacterium]
MSAPRIALATSLEGFFRDLLQQALEVERVELQAETYAYVLKLCTEFAHAERLHEGGRPEESGTPALVWLLERAASGAPHARFEAYRHLGDVSLFVSGFFAGHVERRRSLVGVDYYIDMGRAAYDTASSLAQRSGFSALLTELADNFRRLVEVLTRMAEQTTLPVASDLDALFARFARNPDSAMLGRRLCRLGAGPVWSNANSNSSPNSASS